MHPIFKQRLADMPVSARLLLTAVLFTLGTGYLFALTNMTLKVGFTKEDVALHYYGNEASREALRELEQEEVPAESGGEVVEGEEFSFDDLEQDADISSEPIVPVPTLEALVAEGHFHLFGYTSIFFLCGLVVLFADLRLWLKNTLIVAPFAASVLDIWSMLLTRFVGAGFSWMLMISGFVMALSFLCVFSVGIYQMWFQKQPVAA
ncbi:MAG: hypothetical protein ACE5G0_20180 [Rhodothermales bacterium]